LNWKNKFNFTILKLIEGYIIVNKIKEKKTILSEFIGLHITNVTSKQIRFFQYIKTNLGPNGFPAKPSVAPIRPILLDNMLFYVFFFFSFMSCPHKFFRQFFYAYKWFFYIYGANTFFYVNGKPSPIFVTDNFHDTTSMA
jgi:hypothetical protein